MGNLNDGPPIPTKRWALYRAGQLLVQSADARFRAPRLASDGQVPRSPADISPGWLTAVLCADAPGGRVETVRTVGSSAGTTTRQTLELTYNDAGAAAGLPTLVFAKCVTTLAQRLMLGLGGFIDSEAGFYARVRPGLDIEAPIGYWGAVDARSWHSVVLLEDVTTTRGASFWQPSTRVSRSQIEDLVGQMARWHGTLWESPQLAEWRWLRTPGEQLRVIDALIGLADRRAAGAHRAGAVIPARLRDRQVDLFNGMRRSMELASRGPRTYLHGDLHIANTYVTRDQTMGVADWQVGLQGSWAFDYAYLLATAVEVEDRRSWEGDLLDLYLEQLVAAGGARIARDEAWQAYRQATLYPYFAWTYTLGRGRLQPRFQPDQVSLLMIERIAAAIDDLKSLSAVGL